MNIVEHHYGSHFVQVLVFAVHAARSSTYGVHNDDLSNAPFDRQELARLQAGLHDVAKAASERGDLTSGQADLIQRKIDELAVAATRLGRKDWVNVAVGTLANLVVSAALNTEAARFLFQCMGNALNWLLNEAFRLLP